MSRHPDPLSIYSEAVSAAGYHQDCLIFLSLAHIIHPRGHYGYMVAYCSSRTLDSHAYRHVTTRKPFQCQVPFCRTLTTHQEVK
jgi:hypothetical protein